MDSSKKHKSNYDRVMSRTFNRSRSSVRSNAIVTRHEIPSSVRVGAKPSGANVNSSVFSDLPVVLNDYVPESERARVPRRPLVKPRRTLKSLDPGNTRSPPRSLRSRDSVKSNNNINIRARGSAPAVVDSTGGDWSEYHVRQCYSSRSHTRLKELKDEIKNYDESNKFLKLRSQLYKSCGVMLDDVGGVAQDKAVQAEPPDQDQIEFRMDNWLRAVRREKPDSPRSLTVCESHFERRFVKENADRKRLSQRALPTLLLGDAAEQPATSSGTANQPQKAPTGKLYDRMKKIFGVEVAELVKSSIMIKRKLNKPKFDLFALTLYYARPQLYVALRKTLFLPPPQTLEGVNISFTTENNEYAFAALEAKVDFMTDKQKDCSVVVDTMPLEHNLFYDSNLDRIVGFVEVDGVQKAQPATNALVVMVRGIFADWEHIIAYSLICENCNNTLKWIEKLIVKLFDIGLLVRALVTKTGSSIDNELKQNALKEYLLVNNKPVFYISDVPHLIKLLQKDLTENNFAFNGFVAKWEHFIKCYKYDSEKPFRLAPKLVKEHFCPVNTDAQTDVSEVFSASVGAAMSTCIDLDVLDQEAVGTVSIILKINQFMDLINSFDGFSNSPEQDKIITIVTFLLDNLQITRLKDRKNVTDNALFIKGLRLTIANILSLYRSLQLENYPNLITGHLNVKCLNSLFAEMKSQNNGKKLTSVQFVEAIKKKFLSNLLEKLNHDASEKDMETFLNLVKTINTALKPDDSSTQHVFLVKKSDYDDFEVPECNGLFYVVGYFLEKCQLNHGNNCESMNNFGLQGDYSDDSVEMPVGFIDFVHKMEEIFQFQFQAEHLTGNLVKVLIESMSEISYQPCACFPTAYAKELYITLRILYTVELNNRKYNNKDDPSFIISNL